MSVPPASPACPGAAPLRPALSAAAPGPRQDRARGRTHLPLLSVLLAAALLPAGAGAQERALTIAGWGGSWDKAYKEGVWDIYSGQTGVTIHQEEWGGELARLRAQVQSGAVTYDLVSLEVPAADIGCAEGLLVELDPSVTGPEDGWLPGALHDCGMASDTWANILVYDRGAFPGGGPSSWADFFDTEKFPGKRGLAAQAQYTLENALLGDGVPADQVYALLETPEGVDRAFAKLDSIRDHLVFWHNSTQAVQNLAAGEVVMSDQYNARITSQIEEEGRNWEIVWQAGFFYGTDLWAIVAGAPQEDEARQLLTWLSAPENQAGFSQRYAYGTGHREAASFVDPGRLALLPTSPEHLPYGARTNDSFWTAHKEQLEARYQVWMSR